MQLLSGSFPPCIKRTLIPVQLSLSSSKVLLSPMHLSSMKPLTSFPGGLGSSSDSQSPTTLLSAALRSDDHTQNFETFTEPQTPLFLIFYPVFH